MTTRDLDERVADFVAKNESVGYTVRIQEHAEGKLLTVVDSDGFEEAEALMRRETEVLEWH